MSYSSEVLADTPVGYWRLGDASGFPQDSSGNAHHANATNGTPTYGQTGAIQTDPTNTAIRFDIVSSESFTGADHAAFPDDTLTWEAWVKRLSSNSGREEGICGFPFGGATMFWEFDRLALGKSGTAMIVSATVTTTDTIQWHHCVVTKAGATCKIYLDAVDVTGTATNQTCSTGFGFNIGEDGGGSYVDGFIDEVAVYNTALSSARVTAHYTAAIAVTTATKNMTLLGVG